MKKVYIRNFVNFIVILTKWELWKLRNKIKFDIMQFSNQHVLDCIMQKLRTAVDILGNTIKIKKHKKSLAFGKSYKYKFKKKKRRYLPCSIILLDSSFILYIV